MAYIPEGFEDYYEDVDRLRRDAGASTRRGATSTLGASNVGQNWRDRLGLGSGTGTAAGTAPSTTGTFDPVALSSDIGQYYTGMLSQQPVYNAIQQNISGQLSPDVQRMIAQQAAERGIGIGSYGGGNDQTALLRALGLTSLDLTNKGIEQYRQAYGTVPGIQPGTLYISPTSQAEMNLQQALQANQLASASQLQGERLQSEADLQAARLASAEQMQANQLQQAAYQFGINRSDAWSGANATNQALSGLIGRLGGTSTGFTNEGVYGDVGLAPWGTVETVGGVPYGTYGTPSASSSGGGTFFAGSPEDYWSSSPEAQWAWDEGYIY